MTVRIDYVTDAAVNGKGMAIDDLRLDAVATPPIWNLMRVDGWLKVLCASKIRSLSPFCQRYPRREPTKSRTVST